MVCLVVFCAISCSVLKVRIYDLGEATREPSLLRKTSILILILEIIFELGLVNVIYGYLNHNFNIFFLFFDTSHFGVTCYFTNVARVQRDGLLQTEDTFQDWTCTEQLFCWPLYLTELIRIEKVWYFLSRGMVYIQQMHTWQDSLVIPRSSFFD